MNEALMIGVPPVVIVAGILLNRQDVHALHGEMCGELQAFRGDMQAALQRQDTKMQAGFDLLHSDVREFDRTIGQHDSRLDALEDRTKKQ